MIRAFTVIGADASTRPCTPSTSPTLSWLALKLPPALRKKNSRFAAAFAGRFTVYVTPQIIPWNEPLATLVTVSPRARNSPLGLIWSIGGTETGIGVGTGGGTTTIGRLRTDAEQVAVTVLEAESCTKTEAETVPVAAYVATAELEVPDTP